jgi:hypothetical protein
MALKMRKQQNFIKFILIALSLIITNNVIAQLSEVTYEDDNIRITANMKDVYYSKIDTVRIYYQVDNLSKKNLYIFDCEFSYSETVQIEGIITNINLGGAWLFNPGYYSSYYLNLIKIKPNKKFSFNFSFSFDKEEELKVYLYNELQNIFSGSSHFIRFRSAYLNDLKGYDINNETDRFKLEINTDEEGGFYDGNLKRIILSSFEIKVLDK